MTRLPSGGDRPTPRPAPAGSRFGGLPSGLPIAAVMSIIGLLVIAIGTLAVSNGSLPFVSLSGGNGHGGSFDPGAINRTPTPPNIVVVPTQPPGLDVPGTLVYAKDGSIWVQQGGAATQLTSGGKDSMPSFAPDGSSVYFVRTRQVIGLWMVDGNQKQYLMDVPSVMSVPFAGGDPTTVLDGLVDPAGKLKWMGFLREPVVSPDGRTIAVATDLPDPTRSDIVIKLYGISTHKITDPGIGQVPPLGHQDPAWRPDGQRLAFVRNDRDGAKGIPRIYLYNPSTGKAAPITGPGYLHPAWSPDGRYLAVTRTSAYGTDVAILDARTGSELLRLTNDGQSWAPAWSPRGDQIAYLHVSGQVVDLRLAQLDGTAPAWTIRQTIDLTSGAGLDGVSRPGWFIPASQTSATPAPSDAATVAPSVP